MSHPWMRSFRPLAPLSDFPPVIQPLSGSAAFKGRFIRGHLPAIPLENYQSGSRNRLHLKQNLFAYRRKSLCHEAPASKPAEKGQHRTSAAHGDASAIQGCPRGLIALRGHSAYQTLVDEHDLYPAVLLASFRRIVRGHRIVFTPSGRNHAFRRNADFLKETDDVGRPGH